MLSFTLATMCLMASARAAAVSPGQGLTLLSKRGEIDKYIGTEGEWDVEIGIGGGEFNWGTTPIWAAIDTLISKCDGLSCDSEWDVATKRVMGEDTDTPTAKDGMKLKANAIFDEWMRNGLVEILKHVSSLSYTKTNTVYWDPPCLALGSDECTWGADGPVDQYHGPKRLTVRALHKPTGKDSFMTVEADEPEKGASDVCTTLIGAAAGIAGMANPALAGGVGLLTILCL